MSTYLKPVLVLIITILIFAGVAYLADNELLEFIQTRFFNPSVLNSYVRKNSSDAELSQNHIFELQDKFALTLKDPAVQRSFLYNQSNEDIFERSSIYGKLLETTGGLQMVQFVDINGLRIHYSTSYRDIIDQSADSTSYRNYDEDPMAVPYDEIYVLANESPKFFMDENSERIIFSFPFIDSMDVYRGTALFYVSVRALAEKLIAEGHINVNDDVSIIGTPQGILFGSPVLSKKDIIDKVSAVWSNDVRGRVTLDSEGSGSIFTLISLKTDYGIFFGRIVNDALFTISESMKKILYLSMFFTFYLALYFLINFRANTVTVVHNRIKRLRENLFEQLYVNKSNQERAKWIFELEQRRDEIRLELKNKLKFTRRTEKNIDNIIDKSWDELLAVMKTGSGMGQKIRAVPVKTEKTTSASADISAGADTDEIEEIASLEEADDVSDALEVIDEAEEIDEIGEVEEIEEIEEAESVEEAEDIEEVGEAEEIEEIASLEDADEETSFVETDSDTAGVMKAETIDEIEEVEDIELLEDEMLDEVNEPAPAAASLAAKEPQKTEIIAEDVKVYKQAAETAADEPKPRRGLSALASEIEFNLRYPAGASAPEEEDTIPEMNIVSPFDSMMSAFDDMKTSVMEDVSDEEPKKTSGKRSAVKKGSAKKTAEKRSSKNNNDLPDASKEEKPKRKRSSRTNTDSQASSQTSEKDDLLSLPWEKPTYEEISLLPWETPQTASSSAKKRKK